jgi:uncharacterized protein (DUF2141 family)
MKKKSCLFEIRFIKSAIFVILLVFCFQTTLSKNNSKTGTVIVEVGGFINNEGAVLSQIFNSPVFFPTKSKQAFRDIKGKITSNKAKLYFYDLPFGQYALTTHHDENNNGFMDKNFLGMPNEGYGLSNNPKIFLTIPTFEECSFNLNSDSLVVYVWMKN